MCLSHAGAAIAVMVGKRYAIAESTAKARSTLHRQYTTHDLETGRANGNATGNANGDAFGFSRRAKPGVWRFKDAARTALEDKRREDLKKAICTPINYDTLESFRNSDEELKHIKKKQVRAFYEAQNERLNDWREVDALVMAVADDVLEVSLANAQDLSEGKDSMFEGTRS